VAVGVAVAAGFVGVTEGPTGVFVGATGVLVGGTGVLVGATDVLVGVGLGPPPPATVAAVEGVVIFVSLKSASVYVWFVKTISPPPTHPCTVMVPTENAVVWFVENVAPKLNCDPPGSPDAEMPDAAVTLTRLISDGTTLKAIVNAAMTNPFGSIETSIAVVAAPSLQPPLAMVEVE
jgi:hypothetical protein